MRKPSAQLAESLLNEGAGDILKVLLMPELNGMSVVVTRAAHQAEELCQLIEAAGGRPVQVPVTRIEPAAEASAKLALLRPNLQSINVAIFISPNAATYGLNLLAVPTFIFQADASSLP